MAVFRIAGSCTNTNCPACFPTPANTGTFIMHTCTMHITTYDLPDLGIIKVPLKNETTKFILQSLPRSRKQSRWS